MFRVEVKTSAGWSPVETLPPMASEHEAMKVVIERYESEVLAVLVGGSETVRVVEVDATPA